MSISKPINLRTSSLSVAGKAKNAAPQSLLEGKNTLQSIELQQILLPNLHLTKVSKQMHISNRFLDDALFVFHKHDKALKEGDII